MVTKDYICECGWNAVAENGLHTGTCSIVNGQKTATDFGPGFEIKVSCTCPECGTEFEYFDGYP